MTSALAAFWETLETNFPLGGPRRHLRELVGSDVVGALEKAGALKYQRVADRYPCPRPGGEGCPRHVVELDDGRFEAVCGNDPPECADLPLTEMDLAFLAVVPEELCAVIAKALQIRASVEALPGRRHVLRVGSFIPEAGIKHTVYLAVRCGERDYAECLDGLKALAAGQTFAVLVPTERYINEETRRSLATVGAPVVALVDAIDLGADGGLTASVDPLKLFDAIGRHGPGPLATAPSVVARALLRSRDGKPEWHDLDKAAYDGLVAAADEYDIFADELSKSAIHGHGKARKHKKNVQGSYFPMIRAAAERRSNFDPGTGDNDPDSAKQIFQRARKAIDLGSGNNWALFKTDIVDSHATYRFDPDPSVTFALVFSPKA